MTALPQADPSNAPVDAAQTPAQRSVPRRSRRTLVAALAAAAALAVWCALRAQDLAHPERGAENLEASYHVLLTVTALGRTPPADHLFLPLVSLGRAGDKGIAWGATLPTPRGDYVYTSFSAVGFVLPYFAFALAGVEPSLRAILVLNCALHLLFAGGVAWLALALGRACRMDGESRALAAAAALAVSLLAAETLQTYSNVYWSHSLSQILIVAQLGAALALENAVAQGRRARGPLLGLGALAFATAFTEWTGFVLAGGMAALYVQRFLRSRQFVWGAAAAIVALAALLAGIALLGHLAAAVGLGPAAQALASRFFLRGPRPGLFQALMQGYAASYGWLLLVAPAAAALAWRRLAGGGPARRLFGLLLLLSLVPVLENAVMLQHAVQFSYDRAKLAIALALAAALAVATLRGRAQPLAAGCLAAALGQNVAAYPARSDAYREWADIDANNRRLVSEAGEIVSAGCALLGTNGAVRGYLNLLAGRGIHEGQLLESTVRKARESGACAAVYLYADPVWPDLPRVSRIVVVDGEGRRSID